MLSFSHFDTAEYTIPHFTAWVNVLCITNKKLDANSSFLKTILSCNNVQSKNPKVARKSQVCTRWFSASCFLKPHGPSHLQFPCPSFIPIPMTSKYQRRSWQAKLWTQLPQRYYNPQGNKHVPAALFGRRTSVDTVCSHRSCPLVHGLRKCAAATCLLGQTLK